MSGWGEPLPSGESAAKRGGKPRCRFGHLLTFPPVIRLIRQHGNAGTAWETIIAMGPVGFRSGFQRDHWL